MRQGPSRSAGAPSTVAVTPQYGRARSAGAPQTIPGMTSSPPGISFAGGFKDGVLPPPISSSWWDFGRRIMAAGQLELRYSGALRNRHPSIIEEIPSSGIFALKALEDLPDHLHLFFTVTEAEAWHGEDIAPGYSAYHYVVREFSEDIDDESPECNEAWVVGVDKAKMQPIKVFYRDRPGQDGTLGVAARSDEWQGEPLIYGYYSSQLTSYVACVRALKTLVPRVTNIRYIARIACDLLRWPDGRPVWRGDILAIDGEGYYLVKSFGGTIDRTAEHRTVEEEDGDATNFASMTYVLEKLYPWDDE